MGKPWSARLWSDCVRSDTGRQWRAGIDLVSIWCRLFAFVLRAGLASARDRRGRAPRRDVLARFPADGGSETGLLEAGGFSLKETTRRGLA